MTPAFVVATYRRFAWQSVGCGPKGGIAPVLLLKKQEKQVEARGHPLSKERELPRFSIASLHPIDAVGRLGRITPTPTRPHRGGGSALSGPPPSWGRVWEGVSTAIQFYRKPLLATGSLSIVRVIAGYGRDDPT
jgi:hypothetical protein